MSFPIRTLGLVAGAALLAAACGSAATSGSPGPSSTFPNVSPSAGVGGASGTPELSGGSGDLTGGTGGMGTTGDLTGGTGGTGGGMTGDQLVGTIPTRIADMKLTVKTATPADLPVFGSATGATLLSGLATTLGVDPSKMTAAVGTSTNGKLTIGALDVPGVDVTQLKTMLTTAFSSLGATGTSFAGVSVTAIPLDGATVYAYTTGSTIYFVKGSDDMVAEEGLIALP